jgi:N-acylglucosamine 2-epimerase
MTKPDSISVLQADKLREHYRDALLGDIVPWWEHNAVDRECGGFYSCLERNGRPYSTEKFMWMNARAVWMFSHLYNEVEHRPQWHEMAEHGARFMLKHAFREDGKMFFRLTREGKPMAKSLSIYSESFATIALAELSVATGDRLYWDRAVQMYDRLMPRFGQPSDTALLGYPLEAEFHLHAHDMVRITLAWVMNALEPSDRWKADLSLSVDSILKRHWKPELGAMLENTAMDGRPMLDLPEGRMVNPGHAIECAWMLLEIAESRNDDALRQTAYDIILASLKRGWDEKYGGIRYVLNIDGSPCHPLEADMKLWWPHCETLYALLLAWKTSGRADFGRWYEKVHDYTFGAFPDREYGEWYGYLNRDGSPTWTAKATAWKCFFHLPRVLLRCHQLLSPEKCDKSRHFLDNRHSASGQESRLHSQPQSSSSRHNP